MDGLLHWIEDYTIISELGWLAVVWIAIVQPVLAVLLSERQLRRPDADEVIERLDGAPWDEALENDLRDKTPLPE